MGSRVCTAAKGLASVKTASGRESKPSPRRAQTTLPAVGIALVLLTVVTALGLAMADSAITSADRTPDERRVAAATADLLVDADGPLTDRANVLSQSRVASFDAAALRRTAPPASEYAVAVELDGTRLAATGDTVDGTTIRRLVLVERRTRATVEPNGTSVTLPRRAENATVTITPPPGTSVWTVRANDRVLLHNGSGLRGTFAVDLPTYETTQLQFQTAGQLPDGSVRITYDAPRTTKATLAVTVDA
ncbi:MULTISPECIES: DUF7263 family protein [Haloarcula]|uniref:Uncharacterized protein n=1 Tax=Haloarcula pellucida TaxID=1427151 RepID=A0A830GP52_9EURY|nr:MULTISPECIES: hypothetical protein [Halomicroarcula]MBX0350314.1 hypothetical protein [Halomicroarcula pellucida]MDS0277584.1 hypothetical protein [Halomicroarcula sp. S1AR25-4]GGO01481.1 hypothetical protein GCM10009030_35170 [Halomicroarcula pellucida]